MTKTGRILFQDLTRAVAGAEIAVLLHEGYVETFRLAHRKWERLGGLPFPLRPGDFINFLRYRLPRFI